MVFGISASSKIMVSQFLAIYLNGPVSFGINLDFFPGKPFVLHHCIQGRPFEEDE